MQPRKEDLDHSRKWAVDKYPDYLKGKKVFALPGAFYAACIRLCAEAGMERADTIEEADVVLFVGGEDIDPQLYGEKACPRTSFNVNRDKVEIDAYTKALSLGKVMFGICRGAQFLHAMNGGKLWQDVENHAGRDHDVYDVEQGVVLSVTSLHHQMLRYNPAMEVVGVCKEQISRRFEAEGEVVECFDNDEVELEIEAGYYEKTKCWFVQGHPEVGSRAYRTWTMSWLADLMMEWEPEDTYQLENHIPVSMDRE